MPRCLDFSGLFGWYICHCCSLLASSVSQDWVQQVGEMPSFWRHATVFNAWDVQIEHHRQCSHDLYGEHRFACHVSRICARRRLEDLPSSLGSMLWWYWLPSHSCGIRWYIIVSRYGFCPASMNKPFAAFTICLNKCMSSLWRFKNFVENPVSVYFNAYLARYVTKFQPHRVLVHFFRSLNAREKLKETSHSTIPLSRLEAHSQSVSGGRISQAQLNDGKVCKRFAKTVLFFFFCVFCFDAHKQPMSITLQTTIERRVDDYDKKLDVV